MGWEGVHGFMARERRINVRAKGDLKDRLKRACEITGANESSLVAACVESLVSYIEEHGEITLPLMVLPKSALKKEYIEARPRGFISGLNEPEGRYSGKKGKGQ